MPYKSKINYNPFLSVKENAANNNVTVAAIRSYIRTNGIDRKLDNAIAIKRRIDEVVKANSDISLRQLSAQLGYSVNTVRKYLAQNVCVSNSDKTKTSMFDTSKWKAVIKSVSDNQDEILFNILRLYVGESSFDCDLTYSVGVFYRNLPQPSMKYDKYPQLDDVLYLEQAYDIENGSLHSVVVDLPFIVKNSEKDAQSSMIAQRFNCFYSVEELYQANVDMLNLAYCKLQKGGYLIMKTMDFVYGTKQYWVSNFVQDKAAATGFILEDTFILVSKHKILSAKIGEQRHARKFHSYFFVFKK
ncbi:MAG TPA: winged helix-turn-helix domain-containing protein [Candidatus Limisoma gallistercoris]|nr:winged helix-turn-helix domain-containing protein [Candidatus Limisoma gallistercoris]